MPEKDSRTFLSCDSDGSYDAGNGRGGRHESDTCPDQRVLSEDTYYRPDGQCNVQRGTGVPEYGI